MDRVERGLPPVRDTMRAGSVAALTLVHYPRRSVPGALMHLGVDQLVLRRTPGLRFFRLCGTSKGLAAGAWEPQRYALLTVWETVDALDTFMNHSPVMRRYRRSGDELWSVTLAPLRAHGAWGGSNPFGQLASVEPGDGPVAFITRATIRPRALVGFTSASRPVTTRLGGSPGLLASIGMGEAPFRFQATFSLWQDQQSAVDFAYRDGVHTAVIKRTRDEDWYSEELFARFRPLASWGTWNGRDPARLAVSGKVDAS